MNVKDIASQILGSVGYIKPQTAADDTAINGIQVDRTAYKNKSALAIFLVSYTAASGAGGAKQTVAFTVQHDDDSGWATVATLKTVSKEFTWAADGANYGIVCLPVDLSSAKKYVRITGKVTKSGTITISNQYVAGALILGGAPEVPAAAHVDAGYNAFVQAA